MYLSFLKIAASRQFWSQQ